MNIQLIMIDIKHVAATSPSLPILRFLLLQGGSVHLRNRAGRTPLFLAANAGFSEHVLLLRKSGAHLHSDERTAAELLARRRPAIWGLAGVGAMQVSEREEEEEGGEGGGGRRRTMVHRGSGGIMVGSAPS